MSTARKAQQPAQLHRQVIEDPALSLGAKGVYALIAQLLADNPAAVVMAEVHKHTKDGNHRVAQRIKELEQAGYLRRRQGHHLGKIHWWYELCSPKRATKRHVA